MQSLERVKGMVIVSLLGRVWIPLVVLVVIGCAGFTASRVHGIFGSKARPSYTDGDAADTKPFNPKQVLHEVLGPAGTVADIGYFDVNSEPQHIEGARLPWSLTMTNSPAVVSNIVAQGDSDSIGCRILVGDGKVKAERVSHEVNAYTHCLVKGA